MEQYSDLPAKLQDQLRTFIDNGGDPDSYEAGQIIYRWFWNEQVVEQLKRPCSVREQCSGAAVDESGYNIGGLQFSRL
jgi:hypothetical protein